MKNIESNEAEPLKLSSLELNEGDTLQLAANIEMLKMSLFLIDFEYLKKVAEEFEKRISLRDSASILIPNFSHAESDFHHEQSKAMGILIKLIESLKRCDELKLKADHDKQTRQHINELFKL